MKRRRTEKKLVSWCVLFLFFPSNFPPLAIFHIIISVIVFHKYFTNCFLSLENIDLCGHYIWFGFEPLSHRIIMLNNLSIHDKNWEFYESHSIPLFFCVWFGTWKCQGMMNKIENMINYFGFDEISYQRIWCWDVYSWANKISGVISSLIPTIDQTNLRTTMLSFRYHNCQKQRSNKNLNAIFFS